MENTYYKSDPLKMKDLMNWILSNLIRVYPNVRLTID